jgi:hypothetical protein
MKGICSGAAHLIRAAIDVEGLISLQGIRNSAWVIAIHSEERKSLRQSTLFSGSNGPLRVI